MRATAGIALLALLAQGCIIYEERYHHDKRDDCGDGCVIDDPTFGDDTTDPVDDPTEPTDDGPTVTADLFLTVDAGLPGETLLSTLEATTDDFDLSQIVSVEFERDVQVLDMIPRADEVVLLLSIDEAAEPGLVDCFVQTAADEAYLLDAPFTVLDPADAPTSCAPDGGTDTGTDGGGTGDPCP